MYNVEKDTNKAHNLFAGDFPVVTATIVAGSNIKANEIVVYKNSEFVRADDTPGGRPYGIAATDAYAGEEVVVYLSGIFHKDAILLPDDMTLEKAIIGLRLVGIYLK